MLALSRIGARTLWTSDNMLAASHDAYSRARTLHTIGVASASPSEQIECTIQLMD